MGRIRLYMPKKFGVYSHSKHRAKQGGKGFYFFKCTPFVALSVGHAYTDELKKSETNKTLTRLKIGERFFWVVLCTLIRLYDNKSCKCIQLIELMTLSEIGGYN